jgi:23S rRNA pseudouridine1911/1915/1917 synthase
MTIPESGPPPVTLERRTFRADRGDVGVRLDRVILRRLADRHDIARADVQRWIGADRIFVDGVAITRGGRRVSLGDEIAVLVPAAPERREHLPEARSIDVLFEDEHLLAVNKAPGTVVHPTKGHWTGTLFNALLWHAKLWGPRGGRPGLVHRLDKDTSGILLVAKDPEVLARLARALQRRTFTKEYLALVYGHPGSEVGRVQLNVERDADNWYRMRVAENGGRESVTEYECVATCGTTRAGLSLLRCRLVTGRMHQIRLHLRALGVPIVGDRLYGQPRWRGLDDETLAAAAETFPRQALHAWRLAFTHPMTGERLQITAPLPDDIQALAALAGLQLPDSHTDR